MILTRVLARTGALFAAVVLPVTGMACQQGCDEQGCGNPISFKVQGVTLGPDQRFSVEACIDGACSKGVHVTTRDQVVAKGPAPEVFVTAQDAELLYVTLAPPDRLHVGDTHRVSLRLDVEGQPLVEVDEKVTLEAHHPNGSRCPPTCPEAEVTVNV